VRDAIEHTPQQATNMRVRSELMMALQKWLKSEGLTQAIAVGLFGVSVLLNYGRGLQTVGTAAKLQAGQSKQANENMDKHRQA